MKLCSAVFFFFLVRYVWLFYFAGFFFIDLVLKIIGQNGHNFRWSFSILRRTKMKAHTPILLVLFFLFSWLVDGTQTKYRLMVNQMKLNDDRRPVRRGTDRHTQPHVLLGWRIRHPIDWYVRKDIVLVLCCVCGCVCCGAYDSTQRGIESVPAFDIYMEIVHARRRCEKGILYEIGPQISRRWESVRTRTMQKWKLHSNWIAVGCGRRTKQKFVILANSSMSLRK